METPDGRGHSQHPTELPDKAVQYAATRTSCGREDSSEMLHFCGNNAQWVYGCLVGLDPGFADGTWVSRNVNYRIEIVYW